MLDNSGNEDSAVAKSDIARPFHLTEYESAFADFAHTAITALMLAKNPVLSRMKAVPAGEIHTSRNTTDSGEVVENPPIQMSFKFEIDLKGAVAGNLQPVAEAIDRAAEQGLAELVPQVAGYMTKLTNASGKAIDMKGAPFDHAVVRRFVEASEIEFDDNGHPDFESWVLATNNFTHSTNLVEMLRMFPPRSEEERHLWDEMVERKRVAFNAKKRHRTLS